MARYEVVVDASFELGPRRSGWRLGEPLEPVDVWFQGRKFTWHPGDHETYPVITTLIEDDSNYQAERLATERLLSALTFDNKSAIVLHEGATSHKREGDAAVLRQPRRPALIHRVAPELAVDRDSDLAICLALFREANSTKSFALSFLSFWKAIEVAIGRERFRPWVEENAAILEEAWLRGGAQPQEDWFAYLNESRIAAAHAVPNGDDAFQIDPDDPDVRQRLAADSSKVRILAMRAVEERWPRPVTEIDPPDELLGKADKTWRR